ncbi:MAG TPA: molybdate ABC transporter permease subunit [Spirochaetia bacterium]|nr:molybdate ABC transporter permease subunit [Spirochaetia bacterium]
MSLFSPIVLSLRVAILATVLTLAAGLGLARLFTSRTIPLRRVWEAMILLPMVFPPTITGYLLLVLFGRRSPVGALLSQLGLSVVFTWVAAVIASFVVSLPLMFQNCKAALASVDPQLENAARTLGLVERRVFLRVTLPLATPGILSGTALSFARALGEFGATLMIAGNIPGRTQTIPLALYSAVESGRSAEANILLAVTVALSFGLVAVVSIYERRGRPRR